MESSIPRLRQEQLTEFKVILNNSNRPDQKPKHQGWGHSRVVEHCLAHTGLGVDVKLVKVTPLP